MWINVELFTVPPISKYKIARTTSGGTEFWMLLIHWYS
jgi:hypothetical protein